MNKIYLSCFYACQVLLYSSVSFAIPPLGGSFFNFERNVTQEFVLRELSDMKTAGMDTVIIAASGQLTGNENSTTCASGDVTSALYQSSYFSNSVGKINMVMQAAATYGMKVFVGSLQTAGAWDSPHLRACNKKVVEELNATFSQPTFAGMYFTQEIWLNSYAYLHSSSPAPAALYNFRADTRSVNSQLKILIAPYFKKDATSTVGGMTPTQASVGLNMVIADTGVEIVAPQDGIGSEQGAPPLSEIGSYYQAMKNGLPSSTELWADLETFQYDANVNNDKYPPAAISRIVQQINAESTHVTKIVTWMFGRDMSPRATYYPVKAGQLYRDYMNQYGTVSLQRIPFTYSISNTDVYSENFFLTTKPSSNYPDSQNTKFNDQLGGEYGAPNYSNWVGYSPTTTNPDGAVQISLDLGQGRQPKKVRIQFLSETNSGIYFPVGIGVVGKADNTTATNWGFRGLMYNCMFQSLSNCYTNSSTYLSDWIELNLTGETTRYLTLTTATTNWLFIGEIEVLE